MTTLYTLSWWGTNDDIAPPQVVGVFRSKEDAIKKIVENINFEIEQGDEDEFVTYKQVSKKVKETDQFERWEEEKSQFIKSWSYTCDWSGDIWYVTKLILAGTETCERDTPRVQGIQARGESVSLRQAIRANLSDSEESDESEESEEESKEESDESESDESEEESDETEEESDETEEESNESESDDESDFEDDREGTDSSDESEETEEESDESQESEETEEETDESHESDEEESKESDESESDESESSTFNDAESWSSSVSSDSSDQDVSLHNFTENEKPDGFIQFVANIRGNNGGIEFDSRIKAHNIFYDRLGTYNKSEQKKLEKLNDIFIIGRKGHRITWDDIGNFGDAIEKYAANKLWDNGRSYAFERIYKTTTGFAIAWGS